MQKLVADVLTAWRSAERLVADMAPDDPARGAVLAASEQLQATFNELTMASGDRQEQVAARTTPKSPVHEISQEMAADARRLHAIETKKSRMSGSDERLVDLSLEAKDLSAEIAAKAAVQLEVAEEAVG